MIVAIIAIIVIAGSILYYFVFFRPGREKAEIQLQTLQEQTQEQKFEIEKEEIRKFDEEFWKIAEEKDRLDEENLKNFNESMSDVEKQNFIKKIKKEYSEYILKFKSLTIPKPLDEFYYKKIEQFNAFQADNTDKGIGLQLEAKKIQREVYREYGLDDLIIKWQE